MSKYDKDGDEGEEDEDMVRVRNGIVEDERPSVRLLSERDTDLDRGSSTENDGTMVPEIPDVSSQRS